MKHLITSALALIGLVAVSAVFLAQLPVSAANPPAEKPVKQIVTPCHEYYNQAVRSKKLKKGTYTIDRKGCIRLKRR